MAIWVVAVEYARPDIEPDQPAARPPVLAHAYDLQSGLLAHGDDQLRVGFERPTRGWPMPALLTRCAACSTAVLALVTGAIADAVSQVAAELTRWTVRCTDLRDVNWWRSSPPDLWSPPPNPRT